MPWPLGCQPVQHRDFLVCFLLDLKGSGQSQAHRRCSINHRSPHNPAESLLTPVKHTLLILPGTFGIFTHVLAGRSSPQLSGTGCTTIPISQRGAATCLTCLGSQCWGGAQSSLSEAHCLTCHMKVSLPLSQTGHPDCRGLWMQGSVVH